jgi:hypothetical protein
VQAARQTADALSGVVGSCRSCSAFANATTLGTSSATGSGAAGVDFPLTALAQAASATGVATPAVIDAAFVSNTQNPYGFAAQGTVTDAGIVAFSVTASATGAAVTVRGLATPVLIRIPHAPRPPLVAASAADVTTFTSLCRYWNESAQAWSTDGCTFVSDSGNVTVCACTHLTAFNVAKVLVPPVRAISAQDIRNFFDFGNIRAHPIPVIVMGVLATLWIAASALVCACTPAKCVAACDCCAQCALLPFTPSTQAR